MQQLMNQFKQSVEVQCYSQATQKSYKYHIKKFLKYYFDDLRQENILKHLYYLRIREKYSPATLNIVKSALFYFFEKILKQKITIDLPTIKRQKSLPKPVDREIIIKLINNTENIKHKTLIELLYSSGLRLAEVVNVKWEDIDLLNKTVRVNKGKGYKDRISILSNEVIKHLFILRDLRKNDNKFVFCSNARPDNHITKKTVQKVLENISKKAEIGFIVTPHMLRHSFATHSLENGIDIRIIQDLLGHASPKTTMIYTKVTKRNLSKIKNPLDLTLQESSVKTNKENQEVMV